MKTFERPYKPYKSFIVNNIIIMEKFFITIIMGGEVGALSGGRSGPTHPHPLWKRLKLGLPIAV